MASYVLLTRLAPEAVANPATLKDLGKRVADRLRGECPDVRWIASYALLGPYDFLDLFEAPDNESATKVALVFRSFGHGTTEIWPATPWERFSEIVATMGARS